jgi:hypothetical protein
LLVKFADELPGAGLGLYTTEPITKGEIIGIYENYSGGPRAAPQRILHHTNTSHYAVKHDNLVRDAWDPIQQRPCCNTAYANDSMDSIIKKIIINQLMDDHEKVNHSTEHFMQLHRRSDGLSSKQLCDLLDHNTLIVP